MININDQLDNYIESEGRNYQEYSTIDRYPDIYKTFNEYLIEADLQSIKEQFINFLQNLNNDEYKKYVLIFYQCAIEYDLNPLDDTLIEGIVSELKAFSKRPIIEQFILKDEMLRIGYSLFSNLNDNLMDNIAVPNIKKLIEYIFKTSNPIVAERLYFYMAFLYGNLDIVTDVKNIKYISETNLTEYIEDMIWNHSLNKLTDVEDILKLDFIKLIFESNDKLVNLYNQRKIFESKLYNSDQEMD
jgi:hypothetical protein